MYLAIILKYPELVNNCNIGLMRKHIESSTDVHAAANYCIMKGKKQEKT